MALHVQSCGTQEGMDRSTSGRHALMGALDVVKWTSRKIQPIRMGPEHLKPPQKMDGFFCDKNLGPSSDSSHRLAVFGPGEFRRLEI